jgi:hypothetical protein
MIFLSGRQNKSALAGSAGHKTQINLTRLQACQEFSFLRTMYASSLASQLAFNQLSLRRFTSLLLNTGIRKITL